MKRDPVKIENIIDMYNPDKYWMVWMPISKSPKYTPYLDAACKYRFGLDFTAGSILCYFEQQR
jgi:hypothetical protein